jgi:hypothetical protein
MNPRRLYVAALGLAAAFSPALARGDDGDVAPPPSAVPATQMPGPAQAAPDPPSGWIPPSTPPVPAVAPAPVPASAPAAVAGAPSPQSVVPYAAPSPQSVVPYAAAPVAAPQAVTYQLQVVPQPAAVAVQTVPIPAAPTVQVVHCKGPGPIGRFVGKVGEYLTTAGMTRLYVPTQEVQQVVYTPTQPVTVPTYVAAPAPIQASPQSSILAAPRKGWFSR